MKIKDKEKWANWVANNNDSYGSGIIRYSVRWADQMEEAMRQDVPISASAKKTSNSADSEGITGFMYGMAVKILSDCWEYGNVLRQWHNIDLAGLEKGTEANARGVVLNPAVLVIK